MLAVPFKVTDNADWYNPLLRYMSKTYTGKEVIEHTGSVQRLNTTRTKALVSPSRGSDESTMNAHGDYLKMLCSVQTRFPLAGSDEEVMASADLRALSFVWYDAFKPTKGVTHHTIAYEKPCVLFNLAALESHAGMVQDRGTMDGVKLALNHFQNAAGIFLYLQKELAEKAKIPGPVTSDLTPEGLGLLYNLMMAQAQACYFEKAIRDKLKSGVLSKLAAQAASFYGEALRISKAPGLAAVLDHAWTVHLLFQYTCFSASAEYQMAINLHAQAESTGSGYGEEIARLRKSEQICKEAIQHATTNKLPASMLTTVQHLLGKILSDKKKAEDENSRIYMDTVPPESTLKPLAVAALAKPTPVNKDFITPTLPGPDESPQAIFRGLLPPKLRDVENSYRAKITELAKQSGDKVEAAAEDVRIRLAEAGLPASVESGDTTIKGLPKVVWDRISTQVQSQGGIKFINEATAQNKKTAEVLLEMLSKMERRLQEEEDADKDCRAEFGKSWKVAPSEEVSKPIRADIERYRGLIAEATVSDDGLAQKIALAMPSLAILSKSKAELDAMMPTTSGDQDPAVENLRMEVSLKLVDLGAKIQEIEQMQTRLLEDISTDSIVPALMHQDNTDEVLADKVRLNSIIEEQLDRHREAVRLISDRLLSIPRYFDAVLTKNFDFAAARTQTAQTKQREGIIADIEKAISKFEELIGFVGQGRQFYVDLTAHVAQLEANTSDHLFVRDLQRNETSAELHQAIDRVNSAAANAQSKAVLAANLRKPSMNHMGNSIPMSSPYALSTEEPAVAHSYPISSAPASAALAPGGAPGVTDPIMRGKIEMMRATLGLDSSVSDQKLQDFIIAAKGEINNAINNFLEHPDGLTSTQNVPPPAAEAPKKTSATTKKKGWLR